MPTLMLTTRCPNACVWCFAQSKMREYRHRGILEMGWEEFVSAVDFFERSGERRISILGGDPLMHTHIETMLEYLQDRNLCATVGTTGIISSSLVDRIAQARFRGLLFGVNSTSYFDYGPLKRARVDYFLENIGYPTGIAYTISERDLTAGSPFSVLERIVMIVRFSLRRHLTLQIAAPADENRCYIPFHRYGEVVDLLGKWISILEANGITYSVDCHAIPVCFPPESHRVGYPFHARCTQFPLDVGPDLMVWPCFPLSNHAVALDRFRDFGEIRSYFHERTQGTTLRYEGGCTGCAERDRGACDGGCLGFQHRRGDLRLPRSSTNFSCNNAVGLEL